MQILPREVAALLHFHGVARSQDVTAAVGRHRYRLLVSAGLLVRDRRGIVRDPRGGDRWTDIAAIQLAVPDAVGSHRLAAWVWQCPPYNTRRPATLDHLAPRKARLPGVRTASDLAQQDLAVVAGLRFTSPLRTLADLGRDVADDDLERVGEHMLRLRLVVESDLFDVAARLGAPGKGGPKALERFVSRRGRGTPPTGSDLETRFLQVLRRAGVPAPTERQFPLARPGQAPLRVDFAWVNGAGRGRPLFVEVDGASVHASPEALVDDLRRQNELIAGGGRLLRFSAADIEHHPARTAATVRGQLRLEPGRRAAAS